MGRCSCLPSRTVIFFIGLLLLGAICYTTNLLSTATLKAQDLFYPSSANITEEVGVINGSIFCFRMKGDSLQDISDFTPKKGKSIFFHETSCNSFFADKIIVSGRQACAVESAARWNPDFDVFFTFSSPGNFKFERTKSDRLIRTLLSYENVQIVHLDYEKYTNNTPVEGVYANGELERSQHSTSHSSDILRFVTMWKFGGIYLDLDVITLRSFRNVSLNFAGLESDSFIGSAVLSFDHTGPGHDYAGQCLEDVGNDYRGKEWGHNGPGVVTRYVYER